MNYRECAKLLREHDDYRILTHKNPDGDTLASAGALCLALRRLGKQAVLIPNKKKKKKMRPYVGALVAEEESGTSLVIAVDVATPGLFAEGFEGDVWLCVDHHPTNAHYAENELIRDEKSSCGEIVLELIECLCGDVTEEEATLLYIAVTTDTGCFQYDNTDYHTLASASELLRLGAAGHVGARDFFRKVSPARIRLEGLIYSSMEFYRDGRLVIATITRDMLRRSGATADDFDDLAGLSGRAEGSEINVTIRELESGESKISIRSVPGVSSNAIAAAFGGGGHDMAAGCTIAAEPEKAKTMLLAVIDEVCP